MRREPARREGVAETVPFPWDETIGFVLGVLGWSPDAAWRATPREIELAINGRLGRSRPTGMNGARLSELMAAHPD